MNGRFAIALQQKLNAAAELGGLSWGGLSSTPITIVSLSLQVSNCFLTATA